MIPATEMHLTALAELSEQMYDSMDDVSLLPLRATGWKSDGAEQTVRKRVELGSGGHVTVTIWLQFDPPKITINSEGDVR